MEGIATVTVSATTSNYKLRHNEDWQCQSLDV